MLSHARAVVGRGRAAHARWQPRYEAWRSANPDRAALLDRLQAGQLPSGWADVLPTFEATRRHSLPRAAAPPTARPDHLP